MTARALRLIPVLLCAAAAGAAAQEAPEGPAAPAAHAAPTAPAAQTARAPAAALTVHVDGVRNGDGLVHVALCGDEACYKTQDEFAASQKVPAVEGRTTLRFEGLPPGPYAAMMYHDENGNRAFDTNFLGLPKEGFGFSNNAEPVFSKPSFERVKIVLGADGLETQIEVLYW